MKKIFIVGAGGCGRDAVWLLERINEAAVKKDGKREWDIVGFIDDDSSLHGRQIDNYPIVGGCEYLAFISEEVYAVIAIGASKVKKAVVQKLAVLKNIRFATVIDPSVILSDRVHIEEGCIICAGTILTVDVRIGNHVLINLDCTIEHDDVIEDYVSIYSSVNVSGNVTIGAECEIGTGVQIIQGKTIGEQAVVGAGAVVVKDIPARCTAVGNPAKPIKFG